MELLPCISFLMSIISYGIVKLLGDSSLGFFAPEARYASTGVVGQQVVEFKTNGPHLAPRRPRGDPRCRLQSYRRRQSPGPHGVLGGIDNAVYYRLHGEQRRWYLDYTGCGNTLNTDHPRVLQLIMDSLRYWVTEMHVDGFRFDLASALARGSQGFQRQSAFLQILLQDPVLSQVKLIAEPWDITPEGYQVGTRTLGGME